MRNPISVPTVLILLLAAYFAVLAPLLPEAVDDIRMADVFSGDEAGAATVVRHAFRTGSLELESFSYGGLFYYLPLGLIYLLSIVGVPVSDHVILVTMRAVCAVAALGCLVMTWRIGTRAFGAAAAVFGTALLAVTPTFVRWAVEIHPDLPQLFWILCSLDCITRLRTGPDLRSGMLAGLFAGLAAGTKYAGLFLLPVIPAALFLPDRVRDWRLSLVTRLRGRIRWGIVGAAAGIFLLTVVLTNPYALIHFNSFYSDIAFEKSHLGFGHMFRAEDAGMTWLTGLWNASGRGAGLAFVSGLLLLAVGRVPRGRALPAPSGMLLLWIGGYLTYLIWEVNLQAARHLLPILPVVLLFAGFSLQRVGEWLKAMPLPGWVARAATAVLVIIVLWQPLTGSVALYTEKYGRAEGSAEIVAGRWIAASYPEDTSILFDAYAYVPDQFARSFKSFGLNYPLINHFQPDLIVVRDAIAKRYADVGDAARFRKGETAFLDRHFCYAYLMEGRILDYRPVKAFQGVTVYGRAAKRRATSGEEGPRWPDLVKRYYSGKLSGYLGARIRMGDLHGEAGRWQEAETEYEEAARMSPDYPMAHYSLGRSLLHLDRHGEAYKAFSQASAAAERGPGVQRAAVSFLIGSAYLSAELPQAAMPHLEEARRLLRGSREVAFVLAACYLTLGRHAAADSAYAAAVGQFGPVPRAASQLREMAQGAVDAKDIETILSRHFGDGE